MDNRKAYNQIGMMVLITIITQILMLFKNSIVAANFGVSAELDAFNLGNNFANFIYSFIGAGISTILIPYLKEKNNKKTIDTFITVIYTTGFILLLILLIFRKQIVIILAGQNNNEFINIASNLLVFTLFTGILNSLLGLVNGVLEYKGQFNRQKLSVLFTTILLILMIYSQTKLNIYYYATVVLITTILNITIQLIFLKKSTFSYNINFNINNNGFKEMIKLFFPVILSTGIYQLSLLIDTMIAARLDTGSISILNYANAIISMINLLMLGNLISYIYPKLVKQDTQESLQNSFTKYILIINTILCFVVALFLIVGEEVIDILYERGDFTKENTRLVFECAIIYIFSLPTNGIRDLIYKYFYIQKDTYSPFINSIIISIINFSFSLILSNFIGLYGIVLGTVIASYFSLLLISIKFKKKFPIRFHKKRFVIENVKIVAGTLLTIFILVSIKSKLIITNIFLDILTYSFLTVVLFISLFILFKSKAIRIKL